MKNEVPMIIVWLLKKIEEEETCIVQNVEPD